MEREAIRTILVAGSLKTMIQVGVPNARAVTGERIFETLVRGGLASSKAEAMRLVKSNAVSVMGEKVTDPMALTSDLMMVLRRNSLAIVRKGKADLLLVWSKN